MEASWYLKLLLGVRAYGDLIRIEAELTAGATLAPEMHRVADVGGAGRKARAVQQLHDRSRLSHLFTISSRVHYSPLTF